MGRHNIPVSLSRRFALFTLATLGALALCLPLVSGARSAPAAPARFVLAGPVLTASPTELTRCRQCAVTVSNESSTRSLTWFASSRGLSGVAIKPSRGTLQPRGHVSVTITVPSNIACPAKGMITLSGPVNSVKVSWSCPATPTPTPTPSPIPTLSSSPLPSPTTAASLTPTDGSLTPSATSVSNSGGPQRNGNPPGSGGSQGSSVPSILLSVAALLLALLAFSLYLISSAKHALRYRLLALILPASFLRRLDQNH